MNSVNGIKENFLFSGFIKGFIQQYKTLTAFNQFTNWMYLDVERVNSLFIVNSCVINLGETVVIIVTFLFLKWLFYRLFNKRISLLLRVYSFNLYIFEMLLFQKLAFFSFLAFTNIQILFRVGNSGINESIIHISFLLTFGLIFIGTFSLVFLYKKCYGKLAKYFYGNIKATKNAFPYICFKYLFSSLVIGFLHSTLFFEHPSFQLLSLASVSLISLMVSMLTSVLRRSFMNKLMFLIEWLLDVAMCGLNIFLFMKFRYFSGKSE